MAYTITKEVFEIINEFNLAKNKAERKAVLEKYKDVPALRDIIRGAFDDSLKFELPEGTPPYEPNRPESTPSTLLKKHREFGYFVKGGPGSSMPAFKRERLFIQLLESIHPEDAVLVLKMINKEPPTAHLTKKLAQEVFPNLIKT